jgi:hypothetical protein
VLQPVWGVKGERQENFTKGKHTSFQLSLSLFYFSTGKKSKQKSKSFHSPNSGSVGKAKRQPSLAKEAGVLVDRALIFDFRSLAPG